MISISTRAFPLFFFSLLAAAGCTEATSDAIAPRDEPPVDGSVGPGDAHAADVASDATDGPSPARDASIDGDASTTADAPSGAPSDGGVDAADADRLDGAGSDADALDARPSDVDASDAATTDASDATAPDASDAGRCEPGTLMCVGGRGGTCLDGSFFADPLGESCDPACVSGEWQGHWSGRVHRRGETREWQVGIGAWQWSTVNAVCAQDGGRLPTIAELQSLVWGSCDPALDQLAFATRTSVVWSSEISYPADAGSDGGFHVPPPPQARAFDFATRQAVTMSAYATASSICVY